MKDQIHIATFTYPSDLAVVRAKLEANDIECYVRDEMTVQVHNFLSNAIGGIRLEVSEDNYEDALKILNESGFENYISGEPPSDAVDTKNTNRILKIVIKVVLGICLLWILLTIYFMVLNG